MKEFKYQNVVFSINTMQDNFAKENRINEKMQEAAEQELKNIYESYEKMDTAMEKLSEDMLKIFAKMADRYVSKWIKKGYYDLDIDYFVNHYFYEELDGELSIEQAYYELEEKYTDIVMTQEQKKEYRQLRKESRGRWIGGGFGLGGAVKGAATAGTVNIVTGLGHSLFNAVGNLATSISTNSKKSKLYKESLDMLISAIKEDVEGLMYANMLYAKEKEDVRYEVPTQEEWRKANTILQNWKQKKIGAQQYDSLLVEMFELNPYNKELYEYLLEQNGDSEKELQNIASYFGLGKYLELQKMKKLAKIYVDNPKETWKDYKRLQVKLEETIKQNGINKNKDIKDLLDSVKEGYDELYKAACTYKNVVYESPEEVENVKYKEKCVFDGVEYKTPSDAQTAKNEKEKIETIKSNINFKTFESAEAGLKQLQNLGIKVYEKGYTLAEKEIKDKLAILELKPLQQKAVSINKYNLDSIKDTLEEIKNTEVKYCNKDGVISSLQKQIENFDENSKVFKGYVCESREEAQSVQKLLDSGIRLIEFEDYKNAIKVVQECPNIELQNIVKKELQQKAREKLREEIRLANNNNSIKSDIIGFIAVLILGLPIIAIVGGIAINFLPEILVLICVAIGAFYVIGTSIMGIYETIGSMKKKNKAYKKLKKLNSYGYDFTINKN